MRNGYAKGFRKRRCVRPAYPGGADLHFFPDIVFMGCTLSTIPGSFTPGVMPDGPYGYTGCRRHRNHVADAGSSTFGTEPQLQKIHQLYRAGQIPLWNSSQALEMPLAGDTTSSVFFPLRLLPIIKPSPGVWDLYVLFRFFWASLFDYLYFRLISLTNGGRSKQGIEG